jgi:hypothetical protein
MKIEIEKLRHTVTNIWNIKQYGTQMPVSAFFLVLKPSQNNTDIVNAEHIQQCKIKFEPPKHKWYIAQYVNGLDMGTPKTIDTTK